MQTLKFKTNIRCGGCVAKVKPALDAEKTISRWEVDLNSPERILTIEGGIADTKVVVDALAGVGYKAELL